MAPVLAPATLTQDLPGRLQAVRSAQVRARVEGVIEAQLFADGAQVRAGTPLFRIDARTFAANLTAAEAEASSAKALLERYRPLRADNVISAQEFDVQQARVAQAAAAVAKARQDLDNAVMPAPISGRAGRALVTEGALVGRGEPTHLVTIEQIDPIRVEFSQPQADALALRKRIQAGSHRAAEAAGLELLLEDGSVYPLPGRLRFADQAVDPATGAILQRAEFPNPKHELLPGSFVRVRFPQVVLPAALRVPQRAVQTGAAGHSVMLVDAEGKAASRAVKVGAVQGADMLITEGLTPGEQVIVNGLQKIRPGAPVSAKPWQPGTPPSIQGPATPAAK